VSILDPEVSAQLETLQSLDDAIAFRLGRLHAPCADCASDLKCMDHRSDVRLIGRYQERHISVFREVCAGMDPDEIDRASRQGDGIPPTVLALSVALNTKLRELAADGPVVVELDGSPAIMELDGPVLHEYPVVTDGDDDPDS
jgi:hypothetical protein